MRTFLHPGFRGGKGGAERDSPASDETLVAIVRKWFWSRRAGRGFILQGFPANPAQAMVFDEWLEARGETLDCVGRIGQDRPADGSHRRALRTAGDPGPARSRRPRDLVRPCS